MSTDVCQKVVPYKMTIKTPEKFNNPYEYKIIYVFTINSKTHKGLIKIGQTSLSTNTPFNELPPNSSKLNKAARNRIKESAGVLAVETELLHTELAIRFVKGKHNRKVLESFTDHDIHRVLKNSNIKNKKFKKSTAKEWFETTVENAVKAINSYKQGKEYISPTPFYEVSPIDFRPEQKKAIRDTIDVFKKSNRMLWNAKMRFGKTLCTLEVVRQLSYKKTIIVTHRPVVDKGWGEDFKKIFEPYKTKDTNYLYVAKDSKVSVKELVKNDDYFIYFASIQDLRGSESVGGKYDKNVDIFNTIWDLVIVDEAHEGTTTALGDSVIQNVVKENSGYNTKFLALSGTPFNILDSYDENENIYTWDYIMEQRAKKEWHLYHPFDSNPYDELPEFRIYTYDLGSLINTPAYLDIEDKAFNFKEFFRVINEGFIHKEDIESFLNLISKKDDSSQYPFSTEKYRSYFKHSLWILPGVKEAKALSSMLKEHPVFGCNRFKIVNVAGDGDEEEKAEDALSKVLSAIEDAGEEDYTITLSCGRLTTGVTIPEWTAVFMLAGSFSTSASLYLQTIFRVQSPCNKYGKSKKYCYVFDFAPDRTLKMVAEAVSISAKAGKTKESDKQILGEFLNFCPVIAIYGTKMEPYSPDRLMQQLKKAYVDRAVRNGFDDRNLYNDELLKLDDIDIKKFDDLKAIIGATKASPKMKDIDINQQGFTEEEYELIEQIAKKPKKEQTPEDEAWLKEKREKAKLVQTAQSVLRGISIRMPLLIYGADVDIDEDITLEKLIEIVDDSSWKEFMPAGVTKETFKKFIKYYDHDVFIAAGRRIRNITRGADELSPLERVMRIAEIFSYFKNPDKETVLTPWRVVNMHMGDCLGGYNFYDDKYEKPIEKPRYINHECVTEDTLNNENAKILEINSKTGLYPLYVVYSIFRSKCKKYTDTELTRELELELWKETVENNMFIICKTPMAKFITKRTLVGYKNISLHATYFDDLNNMMRNKSKQFINRVTNISYWKKKGDGKMKFDAIVGNPPYQENDKNDGKGSARPLYHLFIEVSRLIKPNYISLITPSVWFLGGKGMNIFRKKMLEDVSFKSFVNYLTPKDVFPNVNLRGGVNYFLWSRNHDNRTDGITVTEIKNDSLVSSLSRNYIIEGLDLFIADNRGFDILEKLIQKRAVIINYKNNNKMLSYYVSERNPYGITTTFDKFDKNKQNQTQYKIYGSGKRHGYIKKDLIKKGFDLIDVIKVITPFANNIGTDLPDDNLNVQIIGKNEITTETYLVIGAKLNLDDVQAERLAKYLHTKFVRYLISLAKANQNGTRQTYRFVPMQDFTNKSDIDWNAPTMKIDIQLYQKYDLSEEEINYIESNIKEMR